MDTKKTTKKPTKAEETLLSQTSEENATTKAEQEPEAAEATEAQAQQETQEQAQHEESKPQEPHEATTHEEAKPQETHEDSKPHESITESPHNDTQQSQAAETHETKPQTEAESHESTESQATQGEQHSAQMAGVSAVRNITGKPFALSSIVLGLYAPIIIAPNAVVVLPNSYARSLISQGCFGACKGTLVFSGER